MKLHALFWRVELSFRSNAAFSDFIRVELNGKTLDEKDYTVREGCGGFVAAISKQLFNWTDTYTIDVEDPRNALYVLMLVLAIDAEKCSRD